MTPVLRDMRVASDMEPVENFEAGADPVQLRRRCRAHARTQLYDESGVTPQGWAIYILSDPRDMRDIRYVGQTHSPKRRFLQHLNHAQLWLPDKLPWWIKRPQLRPLYTWIRRLYSDGNRLPIMSVRAWAASVTEARVAERARIFECLAQHRLLLNVESDILRDQIALL
jgi:hypothetical protein